MNGERDWLVRWTLGALLAAVVSLVTLGINSEVSKRVKLERNQDGIVRRLSVLEGQDQVQAQHRVEVERRLQRIESKLDEIGRLVK